jgi:hypothetical protein
MWESRFQDELQSHFHKTHSKAVAANQQGRAAVNGCAIAQATLVQR